MMAPAMATNDAFIALAGTVVVCLKLSSFAHYCASRRRAPAPLPDPPPSRPRARSARLHSDFAQHHGNTQRAGALAASLQSVALAATLQTLAGCAFLDRACGRRRAVAERAAAAGQGGVTMARPTARHMAWYLAAPTLIYQQHYPLAPRCARRIATCALPAPRAPFACWRALAPATCLPSAAGLCTERARSRARLAASSDHRQTCGPTAAWLATCQVPGASPVYLRRRA
jgi:hypothetical protein